MFSTSEVYFHRQHTLNLTNTNLGRRGKNNNPFQSDSYLQNINTILCIVIKYKASIQYWHVHCNNDYDWLKRLWYFSIHLTGRTYNSNAIINVFVKLIIRHLNALQMLWYVTFYCYHFSGTNREVSGLHFEVPSALYNVHCGICLIGTSEYIRIHWNPLCRWKRHFISRLSVVFVCMSTSPSADRRSDPSGETTINGVPSFLSYTL